MMLNSQIRELAFKRSPTNEIRRAALAAGMRSLVEDGKQKVLEGITTIDEVARHAQVS
jgi:type IV pilus assembly protein PilB